MIVEVAGCIVSGIRVQPVCKCGPRAARRGRCNALPKDYERPKCRPAVIVLSVCGYLQLEPEEPDRRVSKGLVYAMNVVLSWGASQLFISQSGNWPGPSDLYSVEAGRGDSNGNGP